MKSKRNSPLLTATRETSFRFHRRNTISTLLIRLSFKWKFPRSRDWKLITTNQSSRKEYRVFIFKKGNRIALKRSPSRVTRQLTTNQRINAIVSRHRRPCLIIPPFEKYPRRSTRAGTAKLTVTHERPSRLDNEEMRKKRDRKRESKLVARGNHETSDRSCPNGSYSRGFRGLRRRDRRNRSERSFDRN